MNKTPRPISDQIPVDLEDMYKTIADVEFAPPPPPPPVTERPVIVNATAPSSKCKDMVSHPCYTGFMERRIILDRAAFSHLILYGQEIT